mmetsp:Transcript_103190/g.328176  ORF Transcript_103190/g.328176 Transcript_103190/m.328176 type:complete len:419 (-) Transcript_103190:56-1312(-)
MYGTPVEVRKKPDSTIWYNAVMLDVEGNNITVAFEEKVWPSREQPAYSVRMCPADLLGDGFDPGMDEAVEVLVPASKSNPSGWVLGRVKAINSSFYLIGFLGRSDSVQDLIVERASLRPASTEPSINTSRLVRTKVPVDQVLHSWVGTEDFVEFLKGLQIQCKLLLASWTQSGASEAQVLLIGLERAVELAVKLLVLVYLPNQAEMRRAEGRLDALRAKLARVKKQHASRHNCSFDIELRLRQQLLSRAKPLRTRLKVNVWLKDVDRANGHSFARVFISGPSEEAVQEARDELEYVTDRVPLLEEQVSWILGKSFQNIKSIARDTKLQYLRYDDARSCLELCGIRGQIEDAKSLIAERLTYLPVYQRLTEELYAVRKYSDRINATAGIRRGGPRRGAGGGRRGGGAEAGRGAGERPNG